MEEEYDKVDEQLQYAKEKICLLEESKDNAKKEIATYIGIEIIV